VIVSILNNEVLLILNLIGDILNKNDEMNSDYDDPM